MGNSYRVQARSIGDRLDSTYYRPVFVGNEERLSSCGLGCRAIRELVEKGRRVIYVDTKTATRESAPSDWVPWVTSDDLEPTGFFLSTDTLLRVSPDFAAKYVKGALRSGELVIKVKGPDQLAAYVSSVPEGEIVLLSGTLWGGIVRSSKIDPWYLTAVLEAPYGRLARTRRRTNLNVEFVSPDDLVEVLIPIPDELAQSYIGNKVRQAEVLRALAGRLENSCLQQVLVGLDGFKSAASNTRSWRVPASSIGARLDPSANHPVLVDLRQALRASGDVRTLGEIVDEQFPSGVSYSEFVTSGPVYVRIADFDDGLWTGAAAHITQKEHDENRKAQLTPGDVIFARIGNTIGKVGYCDPWAPVSSASNNCTVLRVKNYVPGSWLFWCMRSPIGQTQIDCMKGQVAQPKLNQEELSSVLLPMRDESILSRIEKWTKKCFHARRGSKGLVSSARTLVEALIERKVTEAELIAAHKDPKADRALMARLTTDGFDTGTGDPLFSDPDRLEELLAETQEEKKP